MAGKSTDPAALVVALQSFIYRAANGQDVTVREGTRLLASDDAVKKCPDYFILEGTDDPTIKQAKFELERSAIAAALRGRK